jgi:AbiU2
MNHILDTFLQLRKSYAVLEPMLFDPIAVKTFGSGKKASGFQVIQTSLTDSCILNLAGILGDQENAPCIKKIFQALADETFRSDLCREFAATYTDESEGTLKFGDIYDRALHGWISINSNGKPTAFKTIRDKLIAHKELKKSGDDYKSFDASVLGLKNNDIRKVLEELEEIVYCINALVRGTGFNFEGANKYYQRDSSAFWRL